jgi:uncharacterized membrane protein AbrB (regulator of aidB expression)
MSNINLIYYLIAGTAFGALALKTGIPAAPLAGALIGASILSISGKVDAGHLAKWHKNYIRNRHWYCYWNKLNKGLIS